MKIGILSSIIMFAPFLGAFMAGRKQGTPKINETEIADKIIEKEKNALARWNKGDPWGYLEIFADEITYFNPFEKHRIENLDEMNKYYGALAGQNSIDECKMIDPKVQFHGNIAILSYHLFNYKKQSDGSLKESTRWNSTKIYSFQDDDWKIIHNHWSFLQPEIKK